MMEMIANRRNAEKKEERYDLFSSLLDANDEESPDGEAKLTERELIGNIFIFLVAGHEVRGRFSHSTFFLTATLSCVDHRSYAMLHVWFTSALPGRARETVPTNQVSDSERQTSGESFSLDYFLRRASSCRYSPSDIRRNALVHSIYGVGVRHGTGW